MIESSYKWQNIVIVRHFHQVGIGNMITGQEDSKLVGYEIKKYMNSVGGRTEWNSMR
jgi:hypothetical protein